MGFTAYDTGLAMQPHATAPASHTSARIRAHLQRGTRSAQLHGAACRDQPSAPIVPQRPRGKSTASAACAPALLPERAAPHSLATQKNAAAPARLYPGSQ